MSRNPARARSVFLGWRNLRQKLYLVQLCLQSEGICTKIVSRSVRITLLRPVGLYRPTTILQSAYCRTFLEIKQIVGLKV